MPTQQSEPASHFSAAKPKDIFLPRLTSFFFQKPGLTALIWISLLVFGIASYSIFLRREGFPSIDVPVAIITGTDSSMDAAQLDSQVTRPIAAVVQKQSAVSNVATSTAGKFLTVTVQYKDGTNARAATDTIRQQLAQKTVLPATSAVQYSVPYFGATGGDTQQIDVAVSFYDKQNKSSTGQLLAEAKQAAQQLNQQHIKGVKTVGIKDPYVVAARPGGGQIEVQRNFDRLSFRNGNRFVDTSSVLITFAAQPGTDVIKLDSNVRQALTKLNNQAQFRNYGTRVSASYAPSIKDNIAELQRVLLEGLIISLLVGSLIIAIRASLVTVLSMITVLALTLGLLYVIGYTLNVITLFALILGLSLIVDDTIIMVEAIEIGRRAGNDRAAIVKQAARKVSRAMVAATITASLSFAPFLFVGGVLGSFIRAIPITIISALVISLLVALVFIPFFARFTLLSRKQLTGRIHNRLAARIEGAVARGLTMPMFWARHSKKRLASLGLLAILIGLGFLVAGGLLASKVVFNIFPPSKDTNTLSISLNYPEGTTIQQAQAEAAQADKLTASVLKGNLVQSSYYGLANAQKATAQIQIISYSKRAQTAPQLVKDLQAAFDNQLHGAKATVNQVDLGPPGTAFSVQINAADRSAALRAANDVAGFMRSETLKRPSGKVAHFTNVTPPNPGVFTSSNGQLNVAVVSGFDGTDTTTLVNLGQKAIKQHFTAAKLRSYGLPANALGFDIGQESQNQNSFKTLALAFPVLLLIMYLVLVVEFRSLLQPLLIFMAIPFSVFGVMFGLFITNNPISFFSLLGFFALIGLSIKNTILLTDFANQAHRGGANPVDAAMAALKERFRPVFATSLTAILSLVPLAISSPFWQGLAVVLIFGLLSSTLLVLTVFPYYYLGAEFLRGKVRRSAR